MAMILLLRVMVVMIIMIIMCNDDKHGKFDANGNMVVVVIMLPILILILIQILIALTRLIVIAVNANGPQMALRSQLVGTQNWSQNLRASFTNLCHFASEELALGRAPGFRAWSTVLCSCVPTFPWNKHCVQRRPSARNQAVHASLGPHTLK